MTQNDIFEWHFMDFLGKFFQSWRLFSSTSCKKFDFDHFHLKSEIFVFIPPQIFSCEIGTRKFWWISTAFYQWFVKKLKSETVATFYDVCGVFGSENDSFSTFPSRMKAIQLFKAKSWSVWCKGNLKSGKRAILAPSDPKFPRARWNIFFYVFHPGTLRKPMPLLTFCYRRI